MESLGNQQYSVKMDGSGRVTLRNRKFLRKIEPLIPRYLSLDDVLVKHQKINAKEVSIEEPTVPSSAANEEVVHGGENEVGQRRSTRAHKTPVRYEAKW